LVVDEYDQFVNNLSNQLNHFRRHPPELFNHIHEKFFFDEQITDRFITHSRFLATTTAPTAASTTEKIATTNTAAEAKTTATAATTACHTTEQCKQYFLTR
jgi:hypothetical protein